MKNLIDITKYLLEAERIVPAVDLIKLFAVMIAYAKQEGLVLSWDAEDGENWASILHGKKRVIMFHSKLPLVFVDEFCQDKLLGFIEKKHHPLPVTVVVKDWDESNYKMEIDEVPGYFEWNSSEAPVAFSINDFWYSTI